MSRRDREVEEHMVRMDALALQAETGRRRSALQLAASSGARVTVGLPWGTFSGEIKEHEHPRYFLLLLSPIGYVLFREDTVLDVTFEC